jgi:hypothetical protein
LNSARHGRVGRVGNLLGLGLVILDSITILVVIVSSIVAVCVRVCSSCSCSCCCRASVFALWGWSARKM